MAKEDAGDDGEGDISDEPDDACCEPAVWVMASGEIGSAAAKGSLRLAGYGPSGVQGLKSGAARFRSTASRQERPVHQEGLPSDLQNDGTNEL